MLSRIYREGEPPQRVSVSAKEAHASNSRCVTSPRALYGRPFCECVLDWDICVGRLLEQKSNDLVYCNRGIPAIRITCAKCQGYTVKHCLDSYDGGKGVTQGA